MSNHPQKHYPQTAPGVYPAYRTPSYAYPSKLYLNAGVVGLIVGGTSALAVNLHKVQDKQMTSMEAATDSLAKGAAAGVATATATAVASSITGGGFLSLALMVATATGVGYVINSVGKSVSEKVSGSSEKMLEQTNPSKKKGDK